VRRLVEAGGWHILHPRPISADMAQYAAFIAGARGEFSVAKDIYVRPSSGWFSDGGVCWAAAGRLIVTMRTGFEKFYRVGEGLFDYLIDHEALAGEYFANRIFGSLLAVAELWRTHRSPFMAPQPAVSS
jgi:hypothetical protein